MTIRNYINCPPSVAYPAPVPSNFDMIFFGDSRTENGISANLTTSGYATNLNNIGMAAHLGALSGHRLRVGKFPNFGIGGGTSLQAAVDPRQATSGSVTTGQWWRGTQTDNPTQSGSSNKSISDAVAHSAGLVCLLLGTNDGPTNWPSASRTAMTTIINGLTAGGKVVVLLNELPRGINSAGSTQNTTTDPVALKAYSDWLKKWDYNSGDALANPNVIVIDTWADFVDATTGTNYYNKRGYLHDGLHFTPFGAKRATELMINRLSTIWYWPARPVRITQPTANGLSVITNSAPFINSNPVLTPGANGTVSGTWGVAPAASDISQGWIATGSGTLSGINATAVKGVETDANGYPIQRINVTGGSLANLGTATVTLQQNITNIAALTSAGMLSLTSKLRGMANLRIEAGSNLLSSVNISLSLIADATAKNLAVRTMRTASFLPINNGTTDMADGQWYTFLTELMDIAEANMTASPGNPSSISSLTFQINLQFDNRTGSTATPSATVRIARAGVAVVSS